MTGVSQVSEVKEGPSKTIKVTVNRIATDECTVEVEVTEGMTAEDVKDAALEAACQLENDGDFAMVDTQWEITSNVTELAKTAGVDLGGAADGEDDQ